MIEAFNAKRNEKAETWKWPQKGAKGARVKAQRGDETPPWSKLKC